MIRTLYARVCAITLSEELLLLVLTFLVGNSAGGLAGRLAGSLALAAAAFCSAAFQVCVVQSFYMFGIRHFYLSNPKIVNYDLPSFLSGTHAQEAANHSCYRIQQQFCNSLHQRNSAGHEKAGYQDTAP